MNEILQDIGNAMKCDKRAYITITNGMSGTFCILMKWYEDEQMWDVYATGIGRYNGKNAYALATEEGKAWALDEGIQFKA